MLLLLLYMDISVGDNVVIAAVVVMDISVVDTVVVAAVVYYVYLCWG